MSEIDAQFAELSALLTQTIRRLAVGGSPPPIELRQAKERGALNRRHLPMLLTIAFAGPLTVGELASSLAASLPTTSTMVGELNRAGLVARREDERDHRRTIVSLDERHEQLIRGWATATLAPLRRTLEQLPPDGREAFLAGWRILHHEASGAARLDERGRAA